MKTLSFLLLISIKILANDFDFTANHQKIYSESFKLKLQNSKVLLAKENPKNPFSIFMQDRIDMLEILTSENKTQYEKLLEKEDERLNLIEDLDKNSPYNRLLRAEINIHWAMMKLRFGSEIKAGWNVISAYRLLEENQKLFPKFIPNQKAFGCLHVLIGSVPDSQKWITKILGLRGDVKQGMRELDMASRDKIWGLEAKFCEFFINAYVLKFDENSNKELLQLIDNQQDNLTFQFLGVVISLKENKTEQALQILKKWHRENEYLAMPIESLYIAEIHLFKGNYQQASSAYLRYLKEFRGQSFLKDTYYKLAICQWLLSDEIKAKSFINKIPTVGNTYAESDKAALKFYENFKKTNTFPNQYLLKARLLFDGGYYEKALVELVQLSEKNFSNQKDKAEFTYRLGRIFQKIDELDKAIPYFERSIVLTEGNEWHFGASSSLQLGYIFHSKNMKDKSKTYFEKAISYKKHEYKNATDMRARAALNEI